MSKPDGFASATQETLSGFLISLLFWFSLLTAVVLFGLVALSPKLLEQARLRHQFEANQIQLVSIEQQNEQLQRVVDAIRKDKEFAAEMARVELDAVRPDEEIIPVEADLRLAPRRFESSHAPKAVPDVWYRSALIPFAESDSVRMGLLVLAATLVIVSFTWFQPLLTHRDPGGISPARCSIWQFIRARYVRPTVHTR